MTDQELRTVLAEFDIKSNIESVAPLGNGLINDTFRVNVSDEKSPGYVLQRINNAVFTDVDLLQHNIEVVTDHVRQKLMDNGASDIERRVLHFVKAKKTGLTYYKDNEGRYWRVSRFIPRAFTYETVTTESSYEAGVAFGDFERMLVDVPESLGETIPDFHNMELRANQLHEAVATDPLGRVKEVGDMLDIVESDVEEMCKAERMCREGKLPKRICHCDTKVNNMMFDENGDVLCVIDLDTVMPNFIFSDYGDFLRTGANFVAEDDPNIEKVGFNMEIFKAFTSGYLSTASTFLIPAETDNLPYAAALFPFMQGVRFLTDYINGDVYYKIKYPAHNLDRSRNQFALYTDVRRHDEEMANYVNSCLKKD
ncbi:MAG: aminoglycoside phosphotransferase family protein [Prevotella sp.]|nr:aminoglycoside phosphotransferase family protein [Prevotella sp.]